MERIAAVFTANDPRKGYALGEGASPSFTGVIRSSRATIRVSSVFRRTRSVYFRVQSGVPSRGSSAEEERNAERNAFMSDSSSLPLTISRRRVGMKQ
jgi:hypothetical protein